MMKNPFKQRRRTATVATPSTLGHVLESLERRGERRRQLANLTTSPEDRAVALTQAGLLQQFTSRAQEEVALGLVELQGDLSQGWVLDSIAAQRMFLRMGDDHDAPGAVEARLEIIDALEGKF